MHRFFRMHKYSDCRETQLLSASSYRNKTFNSNLFNKYVNLNFMTLVFSDQR